MLSGAGRHWSICPSVYSNTRLRAMLPLTGGNGSRCRYWIPAKASLAVLEGLRPAPHVAGAAGEGKEQAGALTDC